MQESIQGGRFISAFGNLLMVLAVVLGLVRAGITWLCSGREHAPFFARFDLGQSSHFGYR
jgi:hypothetical protein